MASLKFSKKLNSLPGTLAPDTVYLVKTGTTVTMYITDSAGTTATPVGGGGSTVGIEPFLLLGVQSG